MQDRNKPPGEVFAPSYTPVRAPRGAAISCKNWQQEAALRMLMNSLDPDVAEQPESLIACRDLGAVARDWIEFGKMADSLRGLASDATLIVKQGRMAAAIRTSEDSPRALILDSGPAASWTYIGPQLLLPQAHEILSAAKHEYFGGEMGGKLVASPGMSGSRAALPLAATMNGAAFLGIDADSAVIKRIVKTGYCDVMVNNLDEALRILKNAVRKHDAASVGLLGNPVEVVSEMASRGVVPDLLADIPLGRSGEKPRALNDGIRALQSLGSILLDPLVSESDFDSIHWVALSGETTDIQRIDQLLIDLVPDDEPLTHWLRTLQRRVRRQGLPARACSLDGEQRRGFGIAVNRLVATGELKTPVVIVRHAAVCASTEPPTATREAISPDVALLIELSRGATWASIHRDERGHARVMAQAVVADGTNEMDARIERVLTAGTRAAT